MVIIEENKGYGATLGSCGSDPYWCSLASQYASYTNWYGISHPSLPNYLTSTSGRSYAYSPFSGDCSPGGAHTPPCGPAAPTCTQA